MHEQALMNALTAKIGAVVKDNDAPRAVSVDVIDPNAPQGLLRNIEAED